MTNPDGLPYRYRQASWDYGKSSKAKEGIVLHLAEGSNAERYLAQGPHEAPRASRILRGVSATFVISTAGEVVQMLPLDHISGSLNPREVRTSDDARGRWGRRFTRYFSPDILTGSANSRTISIECSGFAKDGPNARQQTGIADLVETLRHHYARPIGFGIHSDFADYKSCPGWSPGIRVILDDVGHGREDVPVPPPPDPDPCQDELEAVKAKLNDAEELIASTGAALLAYVPLHQEG